MLGTIPLLKPIVSYSIVLVIHMLVGHADQDIDSFIESEVFHPEISKLKALQEVHSCSLRYLRVGYGGVQEARRSLRPNVFEAKGLVVLILLLAVVSCSQDYLRARLRLDHLGKIEWFLGFHSSEVEVAAGVEKTVAPRMFDRINHSLGDLFVEEPGALESAHHLEVSAEGTSQGIPELVELSPSHVLPYEGGVHHVHNVGRVELSESDLDHFGHVEVLQLCLISPHFVAVDILDFAFKQDDSVSRNAIIHASKMF